MSSLSSRHFFFLGIPHYWIDLVRKKGCSWLLQIWTWFTRLYGQSKPFKEPLNPKVIPKTASKWMVFGSVDKKARTREEFHHKSPSFCRVRGLVIIDNEVTLCFLSNSFIQKIFLGKLMSIDVLWWFITSYLHKISCSSEFAFLAGLITKCRWATKSTFTGKEKFSGKRVSE